MNDGQSISFGSFESYPSPSSGALPFHESQSHQNYLSYSKQSTIRNLPGKNAPMGRHLQIVLLMQAAEIERLTMNLHEYRTKFKRILNNEKDYHSFKNQANELLQVRDELQLRNMKINMQVENQKGQLMDQGRYAQLLENKYRRALKIIEETQLARQQVEVSHEQLEVKLKQNEQAFSSFKKQSVQQYQSLREELQAVKNQEVSLEVSRFQSEKERLIEILHKEQNKFVSEAQKMTQILEEQRTKNIQLEKSSQHLKSQLMQTTRRIEELTSKLRKSQADKEEKVALLGGEIERLNTVLKDKIALIEDKQVQIRSRVSERQHAVKDGKLQQERYEQKIGRLQQEINSMREDVKASHSSLSQLQAKVKEYQILLEQKVSEAKVKDNHYSQDVNKMKQLLQQAEGHFQSKIQTSEANQSNLRRELEMRYKQAVAKEEQFKSKQKQMVQHIREVEKNNREVNSQLNQVRQRYEKLTQQSKEANTSFAQQRNALIQNCRELQYSKEQAVEKGKRAIYQTLEQEKRVHQSKVKEYQDRCGKLVGECRRLEQVKNAVERQCIQLRVALERTQSELREASNTRSFQEMITEIEGLCKSVSEKQWQIGDLKKELEGARQMLHQLGRQSSNMKDLMIRLVQMVNSHQNVRREDFRQLMAEVKSLSHLHSHKFDELTQHTASLSMASSHYQEHFMSTQKSLVENREMEISALKEQLIIKDRQSHHQHELKEMVSKIIAITKDNSELKVEINKKNLELQHLSNVIADLRSQFEGKEEGWGERIKEKQEFSRKLMVQIDENNSMIALQRQKVKQEREKMMRMRQSLTFLEKYKIQNEQAIGKSNEVIQQLRQSIENKNGQCRSLLATKQQQESQLAEMRRKMKQSSISQGDKEREREQELVLLRKKIQAIETERNKETQKYRKMLEDNERSRRGYEEEVKMELSRLRESSHNLLDENSSLKQQLAQAGLRLMELTTAGESVGQLRVQLQHEGRRTQEMQQQMQRMQGEIRERDEQVRHLEGMRMEREVMIREQQSHKHSIVNYSQRIEVLDGELTKLQTVIQQIQQRNSQLASQNHELCLQLEKAKLIDQKCVALSLEVERLQQEKIELVQEIQTCRFEMTRDNDSERQLQENSTLMVLLMAEVEALRGRLTTHDKGHEG